MRVNRGAATVALVGAMILGGASPALADTTEPTAVPSETVTEELPVEQPVEEAPVETETETPISEVPVNDKAPVNDELTDAADSEAESGSEEPVADAKAVEATETNPGEGDDVSEPEPPVTVDPWLRWWPTDAERPPFWVALSSTPGNPVTNCAVLDDGHVATGTQREVSGDQSTTAYDIIQWDVTQTTGSVSFDLTNSECGERWGITASTPLTFWAESDGAFTSLGAGIITIDIDEMNRVRGDDGRAISVKAERSDGSVVSAALNITRPVPPVTEPETPIETCPVLDERGWPVRWNEEGSSIERLHGDAAVIRVDGGYGYISDSLHGRIHSDSTDVWVNALVPDADGTWWNGNETRTLTISTADLLSMPQFKEAGIIAIPPRSGDLGSGDSFTLTESMLTITSDGFQGSFEIAARVRVQIDPAPTGISRSDCVTTPETPVIEPEPEEPVIEEPEPEQPPVVVEPPTDPEPQPVVNPAPVEKSESAARELAYTGADGAIAWIALAGTLMLAGLIGVGARWIPRRRKSQ